MKLEELRQILEMAREHDLAELELEADGRRLRIRKQPAASSAAPFALPPAPAPVPVAPPAPAPAGEDLEADSELAVVKSPIVGTFYRAPAPNAPPFVQVGDPVRKGQTLCIVEAMKMMNNIDSEYEGTLVKIYVENGQPVQYGERLFAIRAK
ncbi:MAG: acetyl-CoA carboxylase biotin carboxyl carrier protein [Acidobacteria bacterium]|nr:acetyl-CoA carboxylase biotin carboxyl carrier protein [Acidobacteriota bacterium]